MGVPERRRRKVTDSFMEKTMSSCFVALPCVRFELALLGDSESSFI
jgi:hypothetical protein